MQRNSTIRNSWLISAVGLVGLVGCSSEPGTIGAAGGGDGTNFTGGSQTVAEFRNTLTRDEAYHLLRRTGFGATPQQVDQAVQRGLTATVDDLMRRKPIPQDVKNLADSYDNDIAKRWMVHLLESPNPLHEKMALFWHDRFATSRRVANGRDSGLPYKHWQLLRTHALGNYRTFLQELTVDPLMLIWLDGANSPKTSPNENYAREFWELFTLGRDVLYTEDDIKEAALAFTGMTLLREQNQDARPIFDLVNHDSSFKNIFPDRAEPSNHDYLSVIELTLAQDEAAEFVARNLFELFIHDHPSDAVLRDLTQFFQRSDFEIAPLVRRILTSQAMFSPDAIGNRIHSPVEHAVGVARTLNMHLVSDDSRGNRLDRLMRDLRDAGQELMNPPAVDGWGDSKYWLNDQWVMARVSALGRYMEFGPDATEGLPYHVLPDPELWSDRAARAVIVERFAEVFHLNLSIAERDIYIEVLDQNGWRALHLEEPDRQPQHVFEMLRLMTMHERVIGS